MEQKRNIVNNKKIKQEREQLVQLLAPALLNPQNFLMAELLTFSVAIIPTCGAKYYQHLFLQRWAPNVFQNIIKIMCHVSFGARMNSV